MHQACSRPVPRSGLYHQQRQVLLRNATTAGSVAWMSIKLAWVWRGKSPRVLGGSAAMVSVALGFVALLAASSLLSSQIQLVGGDVLFSGRECGWCNSSAVLQASAAHADFQSWLFDRAEQFSNNECYNPEAVDGLEPSACADFPTPRIPVRTSPPQDRAFFRKVTTCVPIETERYSSNWNAMPPGGPDPLVKSPPFGSFYKAFFLGSAGYSYTWVAGNRTQYLPLDLGSVDIPYYLQVIRSLSETRYGPGGGGPPKWKPINEPTVHGADVTLLILRNDARYKNPVQYPWFRATKSMDQTGAGRPEEKYYTSGQNLDISDQRYYERFYYMSDQTSATIACTEQYQVCNTTACSRLRGLSTSPFDYPSWGVELNDRQVAALALLHDVGYGSLGDLGDTYSRMGVPSYPSKGLPPAHWRLKVSNMLHSSLAAMQLLAAALTAPPNIPMSWRDGGRSRTGSLRD
ncbi:hypothetical protein RB598_000382 [Gaeumannomyces tritici]